MFRVYKIYCSVCCNGGTSVWDDPHDQLTYYSVWLDKSVSHFSIIHIHTGRQGFFKTRQFLPIYVILHIDT